MNQTFDFLTTEELARWLFDQGRVKNEQWWAEWLYWRGPEECAVATVESYREVTGDGRKLLTRDAIL